MPSDRIALTGTLDRQPTRGFASVVACGTQSIIVLGFAGDRSTADQLAQLVDTKARCLAPGEPAPAWPAPPK